MNVVLFGATRGMGRAVARLLAERGERVCLLGRDRAALDAASRDLQVRAGLSESPAVATCDLNQPNTFIPALDAAGAALGRIDAVVLTAAHFMTEDDVEAADPDAARALATVNFANTIGFCEAARRRLLADGGGTLCVFSSVAGERGRSPLVTYGATKAGLTAYLEGLDYRYWRQGLRVVCVKPGFVRTGMTAGLKEPPFAGDAAPVARRVVRAIDRGMPVVYAPGIWRWVMQVVRALPRAVMRRVRF